MREMTDIRADSHASRLSKGFSKSRMYEFFYGAWNLANRDLI
jgi:hypothetical protein